MFYHRRSRYFVRDANEKHYGAHYLTDAVERRRRRSPRRDSLISANNRSLDNPIVGPRSSSVVPLRIQRRARVSRRDFRNSVH